MRRSPPFSLASLASLALLVLPAPLLLSACLQQLSTGDGTSSGSTAAAATTATPSAATPVGGECGTDPQTGITLCSQISLCPNITVDQSQLPGCGFRIHAGAVIDLECLCNGEALCPVGVPDTCDQAAALLMDQTLLTVCDQTAESHCTEVGGTEAGAPILNVNPNANASSCDKQCETECAGEPDCIQLCGC